MGSSWYFDDTSVISPNKSSPDNISFNGQLVNGVGQVICGSYAEKGVVYVDSDSETEELDTLDSICRGHGISVVSHHHNTTFQIVDTKEHKDKHVIYCLTVLKTDQGIDTEQVELERRYSDFEALYKALKKDLPTLMKDVHFPAKVFFQRKNLNRELIETRRIAFQTFLQTIFKHKEVRQHTAFKEFFYLPGLREATDYLKGGDLENCLELLLNSLHLQVKLCDIVREIIATLAAIVVVFDAQCKLEEAERYAAAAMELAKDDYLCPYMIPLLDTAAKLRWKLRMDKKTIERRLSQVQKMSGVEVDHAFTLRELAVTRFDKEK